MIQFVSGQSVFNEKELDGIYKGLRQGFYWEQKAKEQEKALRLFDSLTKGMNERLKIAYSKEENYLMVIDSQNQNMEAQKSLGALRLKIVKRKTRKWIWIVGIAGIALGIELSN